MLRADAIERGARHLKRISRFVEKPPPRIARHRKDAGVARRPRRFHYVSQRVLRKPGAVLDAVETLLFRSRDQSSVADECSTRIAVIRIDSDYAVQKSDYSTNTKSRVDVNEK